MDTPPGRLELKSGEKWSEFFERWRFFRRFTTLTYTYMFYEVNQWAMRMIESGILEGEWVGPVFVGAWVAGFVKLVQDYGKGSRDNPE